MSNTSKMILGCLGVLILLVLLSFSRVGMMIHYVYTDTFSFPLWAAPKEVRDAIAEVLEKEEQVIAVNMDAFDLDYINVLTDRRVFQIEDLVIGGFTEVALEDIKRASIDENDERYMIVKRSDEKKERFFFVGSPHGFCRKLNKVLDQEHR